MRYQSFYPFAHQPNFPNRQQQFHANTVMPPMQNNPQQSNASPQFDPFSNASPGQSGNQGPSKLDSYMQTADRFLTTAQQFAPIVQQFAPMVSNLPAMWRLYKGFQSMPDQPSSTRASAGNPASAPPPNRAATPVQPSGPRPSTPRIFQPPSPYL